MMARWIRNGIVALVCMLGTPWMAWGELKPEEIAIIAVAGSNESKELAHYYAERRGVPANQICVLNVQPGKNLSREQWETEVRPYIRNWLMEKGLEEKVRCFLTVYDVPLKIGRVPAEKYEGLVAYLQAEKERRIRQIDDVLRDVEQLAGGKLADDRKPMSADMELKLISRRMSDVFRAGRARLVALPQGAAERKEAGDRYVAAIGRAGGLRHLIQFWSAEKIEDPVKELELTNHIERAKGRYQGLLEGRRVLEFLPESVERLEQLLVLIEASDGLLGSVVWIEDQLAQLKKNETASSFDSELSLLFWPHYPLMRWVPNFLHHRYDGTAGQTARFTFMVARIEAPTLKRCKEIIDESIEAEKRGLEGKVYIDARGMKDNPKAQRGSYAEFDTSLREWSQLWNKHAKLEVVLNNEPGLFQPGDCPDTALYCGWYSLAKYIDAFTFVPGAVAYHLASSEATTLRNPGSQVWCKRLLEDGAAATLGPVFEPYLIAFPLPHEFFTALGTGKLTLVECYYRTKPLASWAMTLVGDPLYNPFRNKPVIDVDKLPPNWQWIRTAP